MGLIAAALNAAGGVLADTWKEFFTCDAIDDEVLAVRGQKKVSGRSSNTKGDDNVISDGSGICVADGQCMIIVENGKVVEVCAEPGNFTYRTDLAPSIFTGGLGQGILNTFKEIGQRISYGGEAAKDQRVYYFNTKKIINNKIGTPTPIPFMINDPNINFNYTMSMRCNANYTFQIVNPLLFYTNICGNFPGTSYAKEELMPTLKSSMLAALQPAFAKISALGIQYHQIMLHTLELKDALKEVLDETWGQQYGVELLSFDPNSISADPEDEKTLKELQKNAVLRDPSMAGATLVNAQSQAMRDAANNSAGAMNGFIGMNMASQAGGVNAANLFAMAQQPQQPAQPAANSWKCSCGTENTGKFCMNCGQPKPAPAGVWKCSCGTENTGKFCMNCGQPKPAELSAEWTCSCGTVNTGKFCMNCGQPRA